MQRLEFDVPSAACVAVEYPGFVRNVGAALRTLGGADAVAAAASSSKGPGEAGSDTGGGKPTYLKLNFRPDEPTSHAIYGERTNTRRLLLRIARPKQPQHPAGAAGDGGDGDAVTAQVVGRIPTTFRFTGLADFQYLPLDPLLASRPTDRLPFDHAPDKAEPAQAQQPFLLIPPLFSKLDEPQDYAFKQAYARNVGKGASAPGPALPGRATTRRFGRSRMQNTYVHTHKNHAAAACAWCTLAALT